MKRSVLLILCVLAAFGFIQAKGGPGGAQGTTGISGSGKGTIEKKKVKTMIQEKKELLEKEKEANANKNKEEIQNKEQEKELSGEVVQTDGQSGEGEKEKELNKEENQNKGEETQLKNMEANKVQNKNTDPGVLEEAKKLQNKEQKKDGVSEEVQLKEQMKLQEQQKLQDQLKLKEEKKEMLKAQEKGSEE